MPTIKPKRHHGYDFVIFLLGWVFPPFAVAARFGIGSDFWLNLFLTLAGYIPGHMHNFYIQNIRNNKNHRRTPKWAQRYGLVDTTTIKRKERRSQWANRYEERLPNSTLDDRPVEEGQNPNASNLNSSTDSVAQARRGPDGQLWNAEEEQFYGQSNGSSESRSRRWHYPANFDDANVSPELGSGTLKKKKKVKKDRFARTEDAYSIPEDTPRRRKKKRSNRSTIDDDAHSERSGSTAPEVPEDPEGGRYSDVARHGVGHHSTADTRVEVETNFDHQF